MAEQNMTEAVYRAALHIAMTEANVGHTMRSQADMKAVASYLPTDVLQACMDRQVIYDGSSVSSYNGTVIPFYPMWTEVCEEELVDRTLTDNL